METVQITDAMLDYVQAQGVADVRAMALLMVKYHKQQQTAQATGNRPTEPKCALSKNARSPADDSQMQKMRARAWHEQGVLMVEPYKMALSLERDWLICLAESKYGERKTVA